MARDSGIGTVITIAAVGGIGWWLWNSGFLNSILSSFGVTSTPTVPVQSTPQSIVTGPPNTGTASPSGASPAGSGAGSNLQPSGSGGAPPPPVSSSPPPPASPTCPAGAMQSAVMAAVAANAPNAQGQLLLNMDQWNYYLPAGCVGPDASLVFPGDANRGGPITSDQWQAYVMQGGFGETFGISGLGARRLPMRPIMRARPMVGTNLVARRRVN